MPERKILISFCSYILLMLITIPSYMLKIRSADKLRENLEKYFLCEEQGVDPNNPGLCDDFRDAYRDHSFSELSAMSNILINMFPTVFLIYTVNFEVIKEKWRSFRTKKKRDSSESCNDTPVMTTSSI